MVHHEMNQRVHSLLWAMRGRGRETRRRMAENWAERSLLPTSIYAKGEEYVRSQVSLLVLMDHYITHTLFAMYIYLIVCI